MPYTPTRTIRWIITLGALVLVGGGCATVEQGATTGTEKAAAEEATDAESKRQSGKTAQEIEQRSKLEDHWAAAMDAGRQAQQEGRMQEAEQQYRRALQTAEQLNPRGARVADSLTHLAELALAQKDYAQAEARFRKALALHEQAFGPEHATVAGTAHNLALALQYQERYDEAVPLYERAIAVWEQDPEAHAGNFTAALQNLASLYAAQGRSEDAEAVYQRLLAFQEGQQDQVAGNPSTRLDALERMMHLARQQGRYDQAITLAEEALALRKHTRGPDHPSVAGTLLQLADFELARGRLDQAAARAQEAVQVYKQAPEANPPATGEALAYLAGITAERGDDARAADIYAEALPIYEHVYGPSHAETRRLVRDYVVALRRAGRQADADRVEARFADSAAGGSGP